MGFRHELFLTHYVQCKVLATWMGMELWESGRIRGESRLRPFSIPSSPKPLKKGGGLLRVKGHEAGIGLPEPAQLPCRTPSPLAGATAALRRATAPGERGGQVQSLRSSGF